MKGTGILSTLDIVTSLQQNLAFGRHSNIFFEGKKRINTGYTLQGILISLHQKLVVLFELVMLLENAGILMDLFFFSFDH